MKAGVLREVIAKAMLVAPDKVWVTMRNLRDNGLLTTGARGVNAPDMTYRDAARIFLAHILNPNPGRRAPDYVRAFGGLGWANPNFAWEGDPFTIASLLPGHSTNTFEDALAGLIRVFAECDGTEGFREASHPMRDGTVRKPTCRVEILEEEGGASISMEHALYMFDTGPMSISDWNEQRDERFRLGRQAISFVNQEVISVIAQGFKGCA